MTQIIVRFLTHIRGHEFQNLVVTKKSGLVEYKTNILDDLELIWDHYHDKPIHDTANSGEEGWDPYERNVKRIDNILRNVLDVAKREMNSG